MALHSEYNILKIEIYLGVVHRCSPCPSGLSIFADAAFFVVFIPVKIVGKRAGLPIFFMIVFKNTSMGLLSNYRYFAIEIYLGVLLWD